jgi:hypothetical protein
LVLSVAGDLFRRGNARSSLMDRCRESRSSRWGCGICRGRRWDDELRRGRYQRDMLLGSVCSGLCRILDWRVSTIQGFAHLVHKGGRCLREEEKYRSNFGPFVCVRYRWMADLLFDPALFAGEGRLQPDVILSAAWFLHYFMAFRSYGTFIGLERNWG